MSVEIQQQIQDLLLRLLKMDRRMEMNILLKLEHLFWGIKDRVVSMSLIRWMDSIK